MENTIADFYDLIDAGFYNTAEGSGARELGDYEADPAWLHRRLGSKRFLGRDSAHFSPDPITFICENCGSYFHGTSPRGCPFCGSSGVGEVA